MLPCITSSAQGDGYYVCLSVCVNKKDFSRNGQNQLPSKKKVFFLALQDSTTSPSNLVVGKFAA